MAACLTLPRAGRRLLWLCAIAATVAATSACGGGQASPAAAKDPPLAKYANGFLAFRHPAEWKAYPFHWSGGLHFQPMVYLSTQPVHDPCTTNGNTTTCAWPVKRLQPDGVLVAWENRGFPGWRLGTQPGTSMRIGGRPAKRITRSGGACRAIGADRTTEVAIASPQQDNWTEVTACVRGPHLLANQRRLDALLASTRFLTS
jgi:hypothetical protein